MAAESRDLTRLVLGVLTTVLLIVTTLWILLPFLLAIIWAATIVVATWPLMLRVERLLGKRRGAAVAVMVVVMLLAFVLPLALAISSIASHADTIAAWIAALPDMSLPSSPGWIQKIPLAGPRIAAAWDQIAAAGTRAIFVRLAPHSRDVVTWLVSHAGGLGVAFVQFLMTILIAGIMYANGETAAAGLRRFGRRIGGDRGENVVRLAGQSIRGVALGVVVTALVQTALAGLGLALAGIPFAAMLTGVIFLLCIAQLGPIPVLIRRGADLPLLLIFSGVIGGLLGFGVVGLFVGPVILAVTYTLLGEWVGGDPAATGAGGTAR
jgi:predicted PurR-regulated permease PerM